MVFAATSSLASAAGHGSKAGGAPSAKVLATQPFVADDPVAIRDALAEQNIDAKSPSLSERIRKLIHIPGHKASRDSELANADLSRNVTFVVPVPNGVLYRSKTHLLTVNADLSGEDVPEMILLKKSVTGSSGRGLAVPSEAKSKGYIQHVDLIELGPSERGKTKVRGRLMLSPQAFSKTNGDFAIVLMCSLAPPYLTERHDHSDPTDDEPTDITTRTSTLHADVYAVWLVNPRSGEVLSKKLSLSK
jgi:hypothetical protein